MIKNCLIALFIFAGTTLKAQELHFRNADKKIIAVKGDLVRIDTDTAYVISSSMALQLNAKLEELRDARVVNENLLGANEELLEKFKEVEGLVATLLEKIAASHEEVAIDMESIIAQLDASLTTLKANNQELEINNEQLSVEIGTMKGTIRQLKKEIRGIWWNGVADKVVTGIAGFGLGVLVVLL